MPSKYPLTPFRIPDETPICDRVVILNDLASEGEQFPSVKAMAQAVYARTLRLSKKFADAAVSNPQMQNVMQTQHWFARLLALEALRAVQSLPYVKDPAGQEWMQSADYTTTHGGDCKDLTVLLVAIERILGLIAEPYWVTQTGQPINHVTGRVALDGKWFWQDGSIRGAMLGESPYEAEIRLGSNTGVMAAHGVIAPAGKGGGGGGGGGGGHGGGGGFHGGGFGGFGGRIGGGLFPWWGWSGLWGGWPSWWWCQMYPYLCSTYPQLVAYPFAYGYYPTGIAA